MAKENYWVVKVGVMKLWRGLCQATDFAALEKGKTMAKEYIEREKLLQDLEHYRLSDGKFQHWVEIQPAADVAPVWHGEWIGVDTSYWRWYHDTARIVFSKSFRCSECGRKTIIREKFCPGCGAQMDKEER